MSIEQQVDEVDKVKRSENGVIVNPFFLSPQDTVTDADRLMGKYKISGVPIVEDGKLVGIFTNRDLRFISDPNQVIGEVMTKDNLITAPVGTNLEQAQEILRKHKIEKLPLVDENGNLKGLITIKDIEKSVQYPNTARDKGGRLLCGAALEEYYRRARKGEERIPRYSGDSGKCRDSRRRRGFNQGGRGRC